MSNKFEHVKVTSVGLIDVPVTKTIQPPLNIHEMVRSIKQHPRFKAKAFTEEYVVECFEDGLLDSNYVEDQDLGSNSWFDVGFCKRLWTNLYVDSATKILVDSEEDG